MRRSCALLCSALSLLLLSACTTHHHHRPRGHGTPSPVVTRGGPPPHAPAHGYRHKHAHHGVELVFDSQIGVYVVVGWPDVYFHHDHFYRILDGAWQVSARIDGGWSHTEISHVPRGLHGKVAKAKGKKKHHEARGHGKGKWKWKGPQPAKHDD